MFHAVVPNAPAPPQASEVFKDSLTLSWQAPDKDGGSPVTGYYVERRSATSKRWVFITREPVKETRCAVRDLYEDTQYEFRVSAENKAGCGQPSLPSKPVVTRDPWGKLTVCIIVCNHQPKSKVDMKEDKRITKFILGQSVNLFRHAV